jgi:outer membrane protein OmpA-like peptidoglycan-associated protein
MTNLYNKKINQMKKFLGLCAVLMLISVTINAQRKTDVVFQPGAYVGLYGGISAFFGENNTPFQSPNNFSLKNNAGLGGAFVFGYDFTPILGVRGEVSTAHNRWVNLGNKNLLNKYWFSTLTADLTVSLTNWWLGYNPNRIFDLQAFVGGGAGLTDHLEYSRGNLLTPIVRVGLQGSFHVSKQVDINLDLATNGVSDKYNDVKGGLFFDDVTTALVGVVYHFSPTSYTKPAPAPVPAPAPAPVVEKKVEPTPAPAPVVEKKVEPTPAPVVKQEVIKKADVTAKQILFVTGKSELKPSSKTQLMEIVKLMNEDKDLKFNINGHTDNVGGAELNQKLSDSRAAAVKAFLVSKGIDASRLQSAGFGATKPVADNKTAAGRAENRRVELIPKYKF